jgi:hypothetical protein
VISEDAVIATSPPCRVADVDPAEGDRSAGGIAQPQSQESDLPLQTSYDYRHKHNEAWREDEKLLAGRKN